MLLNTFPNGLMLMSGFGTLLPIRRWYVIYDRFSAPPTYLIFMVHDWILVKHAPGILVYCAGKWHPVLMCIKKAIRPLMCSHALFRWSGVPYANYLILFLVVNVRIGHGIAALMCHLGFATDLAWNGPPCGFLWPLFQVGYCSWSTVVHIFHVWKSVMTSVVGVMWRTFFLEWYNVGMAQFGSVLAIR